MDIKKQFTRIIKENEGLIFKITLLYTNSHQDRMDLYQEIVYQLWKSFDSFNEQSKLSTWMYRVALNTAIYNLKQSKRKVQTTALDIETERLADALDKNEEVRLRVLYEHIHALNLLEKGIILLYLEGKSYEEISAIVGISLSNVGTKLSRIKEKQRELLDGT